MLEVLRPYYTKEDILKEYADLRSLSYTCDRILVLGDSPINIMGYGPFAIQLGKVMQAMVFCSTWNNREITDYIRYTFWSKTLIKLYVEPDEPFVTIIHHGSEFHCPSLEMTRIRMSAPVITLIISPKILRDSDIYIQFLSLFHKLSVIPWIYHKGSALYPDYRPKEYLFSDEASSPGNRQGLMHEYAVSLGRKNVHIERLNHVQDMKYLTDLRIQKNDTWSSTGRDFPPSQSFRG